jgi:PmbA protein
MIAPVTNGAREDGVDLGKDIEALACALVEAAKKHGALAADAAVQTSSSLSASARDGAIEEVTRASSRAAGVRVIVDGRLAIATAADAPRTAAEVDELARSAVALARISTPAAENVLARTDGADGIADHLARLALHDDATAALTPAWAIEQALTLDRVLRGHAGVGTSDAGAYARRGSFALATSNGFAGSYRGTSVSTSVSGVVDDAGAGGTKKQVDGWSAVSRAVGALEPAERTADEAARRVLARKGARKIESGRMPVIFDPMMARAFFGGVLGCMCGDALARGQSFLKELRGERVLAPGLRVVDDPLLPGGLASRPFDGEGVPSRARELFTADGALASFLFDARSAARLGVVTTGHAARGATTQPSPSPTNVVFEGGRGDLASIIARTPRGLLVTRMMGRGMDPVTGDVSRGALGFFIDGGALAFPVEEITVAGNALAMMRAIDAVGADPDTRGAIRAPTVRFAELTVSGR